MTQNFITAQKIITTTAILLSASLFTACQSAADNNSQSVSASSASMTYFLTSENPGVGANLGGLAGADAICETLAAKVGAGGKKWRAYLSTTGENGVNARDRIGTGPWHNANGVLIASSVDDLLSYTAMLNKETSISESGAVINGRGDSPNRHDILTGTQPNGRASNEDKDTTCGNWTSEAADGSALVGHHDRIGGGPNPTSWSTAHGSRGCSLENLRGTGGDGLFYCFAAE